MNILKSVLYLQVMKNNPFDNLQIDFGDTIPKVAEKVQAVAAGPTIRKLSVAKLELQRPLAVFDLESTGLNPRRDRIVSIAIVVLMPSGEAQEITYLLNPTITIPQDAIDVHGISNEDVRGCPTFLEMGSSIAAHFDGCDLAGYNVAGYDIPLLLEECKRAGVPFSMEGRHVVDIQKIFFQREPRDLSAAVRFYCPGETHDNPHDALGDVEATIRVLDGQFKKYADLPTTVEGLHAYCAQRDPAWMDSTGRLKWVDGHATINFGKNLGRRIKHLVDHEPRFLNWILQSDFPDDTKELITQMKNGIYPKCPLP